LDEILCIDELASDKKLV